jgi:hypothetical protein
MRQLNGVYTQATNRRHGLVGHLFQGRFKAVLVERDAYLRELARYVVLNPVRAGMVPEAGDWPWSSYRAMIGLEPPPCGWRPTGCLGSSAGRVPARRPAMPPSFARGSHSPAFGKGCAIRSFSAVRSSSNATAFGPSLRNNCGKFLAPSAGRSPGHLLGHGAGFPNWRLHHAGDR